MDRLASIGVFIEVARSSSFSAAAHRLGVSRSNVTKHVAWLEAAMGVQLLIRTTKRVALTEAGQVLLEQGQDLLARSDYVEEAVRRSTRRTSGDIRIGTPPSFGTQLLAPAVIAFASRYPDVRISLAYDYGTADMIREGFDLSIRIAGALRNTSFVAHRLADAPQVLVASPRYLDRRGRPARPEDLQQHNCLVHSLKTPTGIWELDGPDGRTSVHVRGSIRSDFGEAIRAAALQHHGIALHLSYMVAADLASGALEPVLPGYRPPTLEISALVPSGRNMPLRIRTFIEFLVDRFRRTGHGPVRRTGHSSVR